ncbi:MULTISPECIES: ring-cleaving dioxygenase [Halorussus]|uniref:ring-cleaving dioxygenase n=1 Tax=Halorussus TaxID=1070314 RepID=UPI00209CDCB7|nr:ring-cleaving dioxygenase [Halorussus vallis]USZ73857.1 ring-cleaving dioxygenase [Halorussus vallis]
MTDRVSGVHHVTAIASDPQRNVEFYTDVLGLRLVKKTVNFDDKYTYHLYYGDERGTPGTILTFFPFDGAAQGRVGAGQVGATAFAIPPGSADYWVDRLESKGVSVGDSRERFGETVVPFEDHDGQPLELVESASKSDGIDPWDDSPVPVERAIRGFHGVTLNSTDFGATATVLETMGYEREGISDDGTDGRTRFRAAGDRASVVDLVDAADEQRGRQGYGTVHHVAFRTPDDESQAAWRDRLGDAGLFVTPVKDRQYFRSVYFREPGSVLFEIATDPPGFTRDETVEALGTDLKLPPWLENDREAIESRLPEIHVSERSRSETRADGGGPAGHDDSTAEADR